jgi:tetratricopeptide (TPR) repeat protein
VPGHPSALEKLLDLCLGAGNERRTAELAAQLETIYRGKGDSPRADRFADLRRRFTRAADKTAEAASEAEAKAAPPEFQIPPVEVDLTAAIEGTAEPAGTAAVHEVDLSADWAAIADQAAPTPAAVEPAKAEEAPKAEEVPVEQVAAPAPEPVEEIIVSETELIPPAPVAEPAPAPVEEEAPAAAKEEELEIVAEPEAAPALELELEAAAPPLEPAAPAEGKAEELEIELTPQPAPAAEAPAAAKGGLAGLAQELEEIEFGAELVPEPAEAHKAPPPPAELETPVSPLDIAVAAGKSHNELKEVFDEFRAELGELEEDEDAETHYNLGIAYREMDLVEEAISEFQKVAKLVQSGKPFRYTMQCYTLLGLCFMGRGEAKIASMWYKKALEMPGLDHESVLALTYDLGVAQETAGDPAAALDSFKNVYAMNIDYRDVASRISDLSRKTGRR